MTGAANDIADIELAIGQLHADAAAAHIGPETDASRIGLPMTKRASASADAVRVRERAVVRGEVPGHDAIGNPGSPLEISVGALPGVTEDEAVVHHVAAPAEVDALDRHCG